MGLGAGKKIARILTAAALATLALAGSASALSVQGNTLYDQGHPVWLHGVNVSGTEDSCIYPEDYSSGTYGGGSFSSAPNDQAMVTAMKAWRINAVRVPLNESCWLGDAVQGAGAPYRAAIVSWVSLLRANGLYVVLAPLMATAGTDTSGRPQPALEVLPMLDAAEGIPFWQSVATTFKSDSGVLFDLYNEPHDISWQCWQNGCTVPAGSVNGSNNEPGGVLSYPSYTAAGMSTLAQTIRATEASTGGVKHVLVLGGNSYAGDLSGWLAYRPAGESELVASIHVYFPTLAPCDSSCESTLSTIAPKFPVLTGELGEADAQCASNAQLTGYMSWADRTMVSYLGWAWNPADPGDSCGAGFPSLIQSDGLSPDQYDGAPTIWGAAFRGHLLGLTQPHATVAPTISGTPAPGQTLTASPGTWSGTQTIKFAYQWLRDGSPIAGATARTYRVLASDLAHKLSVRVTATNVAGQAQATSAAVFVL